MRLNLLYEDHWEPIAGHPGKMGNKDPRAKKNKKRPSFLLYPNDRERFVKWMNGKQK